MSATSNFGALFQLEVLEKSNPLLITFVRNVAVFTGMALLKNIYLVMISAICHCRILCSILGCAFLLKEYSVRECHELQLSI